jgi:hypothetical protein
VIGIPAVQLQCCRCLFLRFVLNLSHNYIGPCFVHARPPHLRQASQGTVVAREQALVESERAWSTPNKLMHCAAGGGVFAVGGVCCGGCLLWGVFAAGGVCCGGCLLRGVFAAGGVNSPRWQSCRSARKRRAASRS